MSINNSAAAAAIAAVALLACGGANADDAAAPHAFHTYCARCHNDTAAPGTATYGPSLNGVVGRKAAQQQGFPYSDALKASGLVWDEPTLRNWMASNDSMVPGTRMRHVGVSDPKEQDAIIAHLKTLK